MFSGYVYSKTRLFCILVGEIVRLDNIRKTSKLQNNSRIWISFNLVQLAYNGLVSGSIQKCSKETPLAFLI